MHETLRILLGSNDRESSWGARLAKRERRDVLCFDRSYWTLTDGRNSEQPAGDLWIQDWRTPFLPTSNPDTDEAEQDERPTDVEVPRPNPTEDD